GRRLRGAGLRPPLPPPLAAAGLQRADDQDAAGRDGDDRAGIDAELRHPGTARRPHLLALRDRELLAAEEDAARPWLLPAQPRHLLQPAPRARRDERLRAAALRGEGGLRPGGQEGDPRLRLARELCWPPRSRLRRPRP